MEKSKSFSGYCPVSTSYTDMRSGFEDKSKSYSFNGPNTKQDILASSGNPEVKRRKRVAAYNMYTVEDKLKSSLRTSFKWIKNKFISDSFYDE